MANRAKLQLLTCVALSLIQSVLTISADSLSPSRISFHRQVDLESVTWRQGSLPESRLEGATAGDAAIMVVELNPNMALYRDETINVHLPNFFACGITSRMASSCTLHNMIMADPDADILEAGTKFEVRWYADREEVEIKIKVDILDAAPFRLEISGGIKVPRIGITNPNNVAIVADLSSSGRPACCNAASGAALHCCPYNSAAPCCTWTPYLARENLETHFDELVPVGALEEVTVAFDSAAVPGQSLEISFHFQPTFALVVGDTILLHLPAFGGFEVSNFPVLGANGSLFLANWTAQPPTAAAAAITSIRYADPRLLEATEESWFGSGAGSSTGRSGNELEGTSLVLLVLEPVDAGSLLRVTVPEDIGITLPIGGMCSVADHSQILVESTALYGHFAPVSIDKWRGTITTSYDCLKDNIEVSGPGLVHLGKDIRVEWRRTDLEQIQQHIHHSDSSDHPQEVHGGGALPSHPRTPGSTDAREDLHLEFGTHQYDWIGLFEVGACRQAETVILQDGTIEQENGVVGQLQNRCMLASQTVTVDGHERGESSGHTIFSYQDYSKAGNYEARYFRGDSAAGNGLVCRGLPSLLYTSHSGAAVECVMEASAHSGVISVQASPGKGKCSGVPDGPEIYRC